MTAGSTVTVATQNIQVNVIPSRLYVFVRCSNNTQGMSTPDTFFVLEDGGITLQFGNRSGLLSSCSSEQYFYISKANGYQGTWSDFSQYSGSVLCLVPGKDFPLEPDQAPGCLSNIQMQINITCTNVSNHTINATAYVVAVMPGILTLPPSQGIQQIGLVSPADVLNAKVTERSWNKSFRMRK